MRHLRDIAFDMAVDLEHILANYELTDDRSKLVQRTIDEFKTWDSTRKKRIEYLAARKK